MLRKLSFVGSEEQLFFANAGIVQLLWLGATATTEGRQLYCSVLWEGGQLHSLVVWEGRQLSSPAMLESRQLSVRGVRRWPGQHVGHYDPHTRHMPALHDCPGICYLGQGEGKQLVICGAASSMYQK